MVNPQQGRESMLLRSSGPGHSSRTVIYGRHWTMATYRGRAWRPPTDVFETADAYVVKVEIAGMSEDDFRITFAGRSLSITGTRHDSAAKVGYHQMEISYGEFQTEVELQVAVAAENIEAVYQNGFLVVTLPKH